MKPGRLRNRQAGGWLTVVGWLVCLGVLAAIVAAFLIVGSPGRARMERADESRVSDLEDLARSIRQYYGNHGALPDRLDKAYSGTYRPAEELKDPVTGSPYAYRVVDKGHFELGATFQTDQSSGRSSRGYYGGYSEDMPFWKHKAGRQSFTLSAKEPDGR